VGKDRLTFRPFSQLPYRELMAEIDHWERMEREARPGSAVQKTASRHADRCIEIARARATLERAQAEGEGK
jgi:hypothetical protein